MDTVKKRLLVFFLCCAGYIAFNEIIVLPAQTTRDFLDYQTKSLDTGRQWFNIIYLGGSLVFVAVGAHSIVKLTEETTFFSERIGVKPLPTGGRDADPPNK